MNEACERRGEVNERDISLVRRVAFDCLPSVRKQILEALLADVNPNSLKIPKSTLKYAFEELETQDLIEGRQLSKLATEMAQIAGLLRPPYRNEDAA